MLQFEGNKRSSAEDLLRHKFLTNDTKDFSYVKTEFAPKNSKKDMKKSIWDLFKDEDKYLKIEENNKYQNNNNNYNNNKNNNNNQYQNYNNNINININNNQKNSNNNTNDSLGRTKTGNDVYWNEIEKVKKFYGFNGTSFYGQSMGISKMQPNQQNNANLNKVKTFPYGNNNNNLESFY